MATKLCQIIAVANGQKARTQQALTQAYHKLQKEELLKGISRRYRPKEDGGEQFPSESKQVIYRVGDALSEAKQALTELFDLVATQDNANCLAVADVAVNGKVILASMPVTTLLFLEKQLTDLHTMAGKLPTLDPSVLWSHNDQINCYQTDKTEAAKTKKISKVLVKYEATKEHPAQTEMVSEDVTVGYWETVHFSGAIPETERRQLIRRIEALQDGVKRAREQANSMEVKQVNIGESVFGFLFDTPQV